MAATGLILLLWVGLGRPDAPPPPEATPVWCFTRLEEARGGGACAELLGDERVRLADCCLNPAYGFRLRPQGLCLTCRRGSWGPWGPWGPCSVTCGEGTQRRSRGRSPGGRGDPREWQLRGCEASCAPVPGSWSRWSGWSGCSGTCRGAGPGPSRSRTRQCDSPPPSRDPPGPPCVGAGLETQPCPALPPCAVDGSWGAWSEATPCSVTCGLGLMTQRRGCDSPRPQHGGAGCPGNSSRRVLCGPHGACPDPPQWGEWGSWAPCERRLWGSAIACQAAVGQQRRTRECVGRSPGSSCPTDLWGTIQLRPCYNIQGCSLQGNWSDWSPWSLCTPPCGASPTRSRQRHCQPRLPSYPLTVTPVGSPSPVNVTFWGSPRTRCPPLKEGEGLEETRPCLHVTPCPAPDED